MKNIQFKHLQKKPHYFGCPKCRNCCFTDVGADYDPLCPTYHYYQSITRSGAGMNKIAANLFEGNITLDADIAKTVYSCTQCFGCDARCPMSCRPTRTNLNLRRDLVEQQIGPPQALQRQRQSILEHYNPFNRPHQDRFAFLKNGLGNAKAAEYLIYTGSEIAYREPESARAAARILDRLGVAYAFFADERDSGHTLYQMGYEKDSEKAAHRQYKWMQRSRKKILFLDPSDYYHFRKVRRCDLPMEFFAEFLAARVERLTPNLREGETVTWHDPCVLGRGCGIYDAPRNVLLGIKGVELVEMKRNRADSWCCGAGAAAPVLHPEFAAWAAGERLGEAGAAGVKTLVTSCPKCKSHLASRVPQGMRIVDLAEYVDAALDGGMPHAH